METVLGIDSVVFISVLCDRLPEARRAAARRLGLIAAMAMRVVLLFTIGWLTGLAEPLFALDLAIVHFEPSVRDLIMLIGGLVLMAKAVMEMHELVEGDHHNDHSSQGKQPVRCGTAPSDVDGLGVQFGQRDHRHRDGRRPFGHGGGADICGHHAVGGRYLDVCVQEPHREDAGFGVLAAHRSHADGGRGALPHREGLHLLRNGLLDFRRLINRQVRKRGVE